MNKISIVGAGPAGIFAAIAAAEANPEKQVVVWEKSAVPLAKVKISGGGRCNVTHNCFDTALLVQNYPRGNKELRGPFSRFQPRDTIDWFEKRGVKLKVEEDGRIFPVSNSSQTIIDCLLTAAAKAKVELKLKKRIEKIEKKEGRFILEFSTEELVECDQLLLATGSSREGQLLATSFGHTIVESVPSLFTFNTPGSTLLEMSGISLPEAELQLEGTLFKQKGPLLLTHWGFSGPAALKLSAWAARYLHSCQYTTGLLVNWLPSLSSQSLLSHFLEIKKNKPSHTLSSCNESLPKNLWRELLKRWEIAHDKPLGQISSAEIARLCEKLQKDRYAIEGKTTYKQEFVTCGGVALEEVNFKTMESKHCPSLYFAGEILDIDGITGGFNFQNSWTTGWIAGNALASPR